VAAFLSKKKKIKKNVEMGLFTEDPSVGRFSLRSGPWFGIFEPPFRAVSRWCGAFRQPCLCWSTHPAITSRSVAVGPCECLACESHSCLRPAADLRADLVTLIRSPSVIIDARGCCNTESAQIMARLGMLALLPLIPARRTVVVLSPSAMPGHLIDRSKCSASSGRWPTEQW